MRRWAQTLGVILVIFVGGCGGGEAASVPAEESFLLLQENDLPSGAMHPEEVPEPCSPLSVLEGQDAEAVTSPLYSFRFKSVAEAVGIMPSTKKAAAALKELRTPEQLACIRSSIESFGPGEGIFVTVEDPESIAEGEEGWMVRLLEVDARSKPLNSTTIVSFRSGRCVATLLFLMKGGDSGKAFVDDLASRAYSSLADAHTTCR